MPKYVFFVYLRDEAMTPEPQASRTEQRQIVWSPTNRHRDN